jgi:hypothetical protein
MVQALSILRRVIEKAIPKISANELAVVISLINWEVCETFDRASLAVRAAKSAIHCGLRAR